MVPDEDGPDRRSFSPTDVSEEAEILDAVAGIQLTPREHQEIKDLVNGPALKRIQGHARRYLVVGAGSPDDAAERRALVYEALDARSNPSATAMQLEDFDLTFEELRLWCRAFDILCGRATHVVAVIEDFDGGYVWELGLIFAPTYREKAWVLKRRYPHEEIELARYANAMAISHVELLLTGPRAREWEDVDALMDVVEAIP